MSLTVLSFLLSSSFSRTSSQFDAHFVSDNSQENLFWFTAVRAKITGKANEALITHNVPNNRAQIRACLIEVFGDRRDLNAWTIAFPSPKRPFTFLQVEIFRQGYATHMLSCCHHYVGLKVKRFQNKFSNFPNKLSRLWKNIFSLLVVVARTYGWKACRKKWILFEKSFVNTLNEEWNLWRSEEVSNYNLNYNIPLIIPLLAHSPFFILAAICGYFDTFKPTYLNFSLS